MGTIAFLERLVSAYCRGHSARTGGDSSCILRSLRVCLKGDDFNELLALDALWVEFGSVTVRLLFAGGRSGFERQRYTMVTTWELDC